MYQIEAGYDKIRKSIYLDVSVSHWTLWSINKVLLSQENLAKARDKMICSLYFHRALCCKTTSSPNRNTGDRKIYLFSWLITNYFWFMPPLGINI